jgi:hypothetical protein
MVWWEASTAKLKKKAWQMILNFDGEVIWPSFPITI